MKQPIRNPLPKLPKHMDVDILTLPEIDDNPLFYDENTQEILKYWTDGKAVYWRFDQVSRDVEHFVWFNYHFAKDSKHCFLQSTKLRNVDHDSFTALNNCYAKDCKSVWTTGGRFEPEDISSFVVCDDGVKLIEEIRTMSDGTQRPIQLRIPYGYAKDNKAVYYENFVGKIKILKKGRPCHLRFQQRWPFRMGCTVRLLWWLSASKSRPTILADRRCTKETFKRFEALLYLE